MCGISCNCVHVCVKARGQPWCQGQELSGSAEIVSVVGTWFHQLGLADWLVSDPRDQPFPTSLISYLLEST